MTESFRKTIANIKLTASKKTSLLAVLVFGAFMLKGCGEVSERCLFTPAFNLSGDLVPEHTKRSRIIEANSSSWINTGITAMEGGELYAEIEGVVSLCADNDLGYYCTEGKGCFSKNALSTYKYKGGDNYNVAESCVMENDYESKGQVVAIYPDLQNIVSLDQVLNPSEVNVEVVPGSWISVALGEAADSAGCSVARFNAYTDGGVEKVNELGSAAFRKKYHVIEGNVINLQRFGGDLSLRVGSEVLLNLDDTYNDASESRGPTTFYGIANSSGVLNFYKSPNRSTDDNTLGAQAVYIKKIHCASQNGNGFNGTNLGRVQIAVVDSHALATSGQDINAYMEGKSADFLSNGSAYTPPHSGQVYIRIYDTDYTDNKFNYKVTLSGFSIASYIGSEDDNELAWAFRFTKDLIKRIVKSSHTGITENTYFREYVAILVTLLIAYLAIRYVMGLERMHLSQLMVSILKIGLVGVLLSPDSLLIFNTYVYDFYFDFLSFLLRAVTGDTSSSDSLTIPIVETSKALFSPGVWARLAAIMVTPPWMIPLGVALVLVFLYTVLIFYIAVLRCLLVILMALITLGLLMIVAPLFLTFLLFQETKQLFQSWTRLAFRYSLEPAFLVAGVNLIGLMCAALLYTVFAFPVCWKCAINVGSEWFPICIYWYVPWGANDKKGQSNLDFYQPSENTTYFFGSKGSPGAEALYYLGFDSMIMIFYAILLLLTFSQVLNSFISAASRIVNALTGTFQQTGVGLADAGDRMLGYRSDRNLWDNIRGGSGFIGALRGSFELGKAGIDRARDYYTNRGTPKTGPDEGGAPGAGGGPGGAGGPGAPGTGGAPAGPDPSGKGGSGSPDAAGKGGGGGAGGGPDGPDAPGDDRGGASGRGSGKGLPDGEAKGSFGDGRSDSGPTGWPEVKGGGRTGPRDATDIGGIGDDSSKPDATVNLRTSPEFTADDFMRQGGDSHFERQVAHLKRQEQQASSEKEAATFRDQLQQLQEEKAVSPETANLRAELMYREHTTSVLNREIDAVTEQLENLQHQDQANTGDQIAKLVERKEALENNVRENEEAANRIAKFLPEPELVTSNDQVARGNTLDEAAKMREESNQKYLEQVKATSQNQEEIDKLEKALAEERRALIGTAPTDTTDQSSLERKADLASDSSQSSSVETKPVEANGVVDQAEQSKRTTKEQATGKTSVSEEQKIQEALERPKAMEEKVQQQEGPLEKARSRTDEGVEEVSDKTSSKAGNIPSSSPDFKVSTQHESAPEVNETPTAAKPVADAKKEEKGDSSTRGEEIHSSSEPERGSIYTQDKHATEAPKVQESDGPNSSGKGGSGSPDAAGKGGGGGAGGGSDGPDAPGDDRGGAGGVSGRGLGKGLPDGEAKGSFGDDRSDSGPTGWPEVKGGRTGPSDATDIGDESSKSDATVNLRTSPEFTADDFTRQGGDGYFERQVAHLKRQEQQASSEKEAATFRDQLQQLQEEKAVSPETANLRAELMYREHTTSVLNREIDAVTEQLENLQHQDQANTGDQIAKLVERKEALENNVRENEEEANRIAEFLPEEGKPVAELMPSNEQVAREDRLDEAKHDEGRGITEEDRSLETSSQPADRRNTPDEATKGDEGMVQEDSSTSAEQSIVEEKASEGIEAAAGGKSNEQLESNETGASETAEREDTLDKAAKMREESNQKYLEQFKDTSQNQEDIKKLEEALAEERRALIGTDPTDTTTQNSLEREADLASDSSLEDKSSSVETKPVEANGVVDQAEQNITEKNASGVIGDAASGESNNDGVNASDQSSADKAVIEDAAGDKSQDATSKQLESNEAGASETAEREDRLDKTTSQDEVKGVTEEDGSVSDAVTKAVEENGVVDQAVSAEQSKHITEKNASAVIGDAAGGESNNDGVNASDQSPADKKDPSKEKAGKPSVSEEQAIHEALEKQRAVEEKLEKQEALLEAARNFGDGGEELAGDSSSKAGNISSSSPDFKVSAQHDNTPGVNEAPTAAKPVVADKKEEKGDSSTRGEEIHSSSEPERGSIYTQDEHATEAPKMKEVFEDLCEKTLHQSKQYLDLLHGLDSKLDEISKNHEGNQVLIDSTASQLEDIAKIYFAKFKEVLEKNQISEDIIEKDPQGLFPQWLKSQPFAKHLDLFYSSLDEKTAQDIDKKNSLLAPLRKHMLGGE